MTSETGRSKRENARIPMCRDRWACVAYGIGLALIAGAVLLNLGGHYIENGRSIRWCSLFLGTYGNVSSELMGIGVTVLLIDTIYRYREKRLLKAQLIRQMRSRDNVTAIQALEDYHANGWLKDDALQGAQLSGANLSGTGLLQGANLKETRLIGANISSTNLYETIFEQAILNEATFQGSDLPLASFVNAQLIRTDLRGTVLQGARFQSAVLQGADLEGAILSEAAFDEHSILPDGSGWTEDTDLARFTDRNHHLFWRSDDSRSPAYWGRSE